MFKRPVLCDVRFLFRYLIRPIVFSLRVFCFGLCFIMITLLSDLFVISFLLVSTLLVGGLLIFLVGVLAGRYATQKDPQIIRILLASQKFKNQYDPMKFSDERVVLEE